MKLHELKPKLKRKRRKVLGRGDSSGHGSYSTQGAKGQKARSGVSGLKKLGMRHIMLSTPKLKGFKSTHAKDQIVSLEKLQKYFSDGGAVNPEILLSKKLIKTLEIAVKIIGNEQLSKKFSISGCKASAGAKAAIEAAGGKIE
jgi:large subunit ribosomal protein L15